MLKRHMMCSQMNSCTFLLEITAKGLATAHLVKESTETTAYLKVGRAVGIGPIKSIPQTANGHGEVIEVSFSGCDLGIFENFWHLSHFLAKLMAWPSSLARSIIVLKLCRLGIARQRGCRIPLCGSPGVCGSLG